jgi:hypothetical protein
MRMFHVFVHDASRRDNAARKAKRETKMRLRLRVVGLKLASLMPRQQVVGRD